MRAKFFSTMTREAPLLKTKSQSVGTVIRNESIANLPLIGRRAASLVRLSGFVVQRDGSQFAMAGGRGDNAVWTIVGGNAQNVLLGVATLNFDPPNPIRGDQGVAIQVGLHYRF